MILIKDIPEENIVFYDIETTSVFAPYCDLKMIAYQVGFDSKPILVDPSSKNSKDRFRELVGSPDKFKVSYNGINFDDIVLWRYGFYVDPRLRHDMYLALKTIHPTLPSYSLKFVNWAINNPASSLEDAWHEPQARLEAWLLKHELDYDEMYSAPQELLEPYCKHDVIETVNVFRSAWEIVQQPRHWKPYRKLELAMGEPLHEMILLGLEYVSPKLIKQRIAELEKEKEDWNNKAIELTNGHIQNVASSKQVSKYLIDIDKIDLELSNNGNFQVRKSDLLDFLNLEDETQDKNAVARCCYEVRDATKVIGYLRSYLRAARYEKWRSTNVSSKRENGEFYPSNFTICYEKRRSRDRPTIIKGANGTSKRQGKIVAIPKSYYLSSARTRRFQSSSFFGINFQNQNKRSKVAQLVPRGWFGWWIDSTQIENVAHIYFSKDEHRRQSYEADSDWSEYVWLCNTILGGERTRKELEEIVSEVNPAWSVYKQFKTIKLALNFGMGPDKFAKHTNLPRWKAEKLFSEVHHACPAIKDLQKIVRESIKQDGFIADPFGHIYSGKLEKAYKIVAYLIQGCGTGSVPKAMTVANYKTLHSLDSIEPLHYPCIQHPYTKKYMYGVLTGTTHDECAGRVSLGLETETIVSIIRKLLYNMEEKFSPLFDDIPLRAKLAVSITNAAEQIELDHRKPSFVDELTTIINAGKKS